MKSCLSETSVIAQPLLELMSFLASVPGPVPLLGFLDVSLHSGGKRSLIKADAAVVAIREGCVLAVVTQRLATDELTRLAAALRGRLTTRDANLVFVFLAAIALSMDNRFASSDPRLVEVAGHRYSLSLLTCVL